MTAPDLESPTQQPTEPPSCACVHPMPWGDEPCDEPPSFEVTDGEEVLLLCDECLQAWREADRRRCGEVRLSARPL